MRVPHFQQSIKFSYEADRKHINSNSGQLNRSVLLICATQYNKRIFININQYVI